MNKKKRQREREKRKEKSEKKKTRQMLIMKPSVCRVERVGDDPELPLLHYTRNILLKRERERERERGRDLFVDGLRLC